MTMTKVAKYTPPAACEHEPTMVLGEWMCVLCGQYVPGPEKPNEPEVREPEWVRRAKAHDLPTKDYSGLSMAPGEWQELYGR